MKNKRATSENTSYLMDGETVRRLPRSQRYDYDIRLIKRYGRGT